MTRLNLSERVDRLSYRIGVTLKANRRVSLGGFAPVLMWLTILTQQTTGLLGSPQTQVRKVINDRCCGVSPKLWLEPPCEPLNPFY